MPAELICLDPRALAEVDVVSLEQEKKERIERLVWSRAWAFLTPTSCPHCVPTSIALRAGAAMVPCFGACYRFHSCPLPQGYDPEAKAPFQPKPKQKGRSSTASLVKRKKKVMDEEHRVNEHWVTVASCRPGPPSVGLASGPPLAPRPFLLPQDKVRQSLKQQQQQKQEKAKPTGARPSALDRFVR